MPRHSKGRETGAPPKPPALWSSQDAMSFEGVWGAYPKGFVPWACRLLNVAPANVLHVCAGSVDSGITVDIRRSVRPSVVADGRALPFRDNAFDAVMIDPPYTIEYASGLYGTDYPRPSHLLAEASRVVKPDGPIGFLHFLVPLPPPGCAFERVVGIVTGLGYRIRAFTVYRKAQQGLFA